MKLGDIYISDDTLVKIVYVPDNPNLKHLVLAVTSKESILLEKSTMIVGINYTDYAELYSAQRYRVSELKKL